MAAYATQRAAVAAGHVWVRGLAAQLVQAEVTVEQPDEGADGAGRVVVLGLAEQQRAAA